MGVLKLFITVICLLQSAKSEGTEDMKVMGAWKAPRKGSTQGSEMCRKEAIGNVSVFFFMNHLGIQVC